MKMIRTSRITADVCGTFEGAFLTPFFQDLFVGEWFPSFLINFHNTTNVHVLISYDGIYTHDAIPANSSFQLDFQQNKRLRSNALFPYKFPFIVWFAALGPVKWGDIYVSNCRNINMLEE